MIRAQFDQDVATFLRHAGPWLEENATVHSMLLSLAGRLADDGKRAHLLVRALDAQGKLVAAGVQTDADRSLLCSMANADAARGFAQALAETGKSLPGVVGPVPSADEFAAAWAPARGTNRELVSNMRLFVLHAVKPAPSPGGGFRLADPRDEDLLVDWLDKFHEEAIPHDPRRPEEEVRRHIRHSVTQGQYFFWEHDGHPVCLLGSQRETPRERWIAPVYTPPSRRGKGYGTALVAAVSERILAAGKKGALFTDLANPVSNSIYPKVGYEPEADFRHWHFPPNSP